MKRAVARTTGIAIIVLAAMAAGGTAEAGKKGVLIVSNPPGAFVRVNDQNLGETPVTYRFEFGRQPAFMLTATKEGFDTAAIRIDKKTPGVKDFELKVVLRENPAFKATSTSRATNTWLRMQVNSDLDDELVWQKMIDSVTDAYPSLEQMDMASGYLRSIHTEREFQGKAGNFVIRTQLVAAIASKEPLVYKMKIQAETQNAGDRGWSDYERVFKKDAQLIEELQNRLGTK